jgi:hypothetical protein
MVGKRRDQGKFRIGHLFLRFQFISKINAQKIGEKLYFKRAPPQFFGGG